MIKGVIFDLDGVIVSTDEYHYQAWQEIANEEGIYFDRQINERLRGISRIESLEIILEQTSHRYSVYEKDRLLIRKNNRYCELLNEVTRADILPGVMRCLKQIKSKGVRLAIGSGSKNALLILERIGLSKAFDTIVDGNQTRQSKPDPEVFLTAASRLRLNPVECLVVEDAEAGVSAALNAGMKVLGVGPASQDPRVHFRAGNLVQVEFEELFRE